MEDRQQGETPEGASGPAIPPSGESRVDRGIALRKLVELAARYPEIGPPLAELAFAIGESEIGGQLCRLGTQGEGANLEYWFVAANAARRQKKYSEALGATVEAMRAFAGAPEGTGGADDEGRFLHLVRLGFATLMFDIKDLAAEPAFVAALAEHLPALEPRLGQSPFFRTLLAQTLWFSDKEASEREWDRAGELGDPETTWNARGTWYNEAEHDLDKAERAYRRGLDDAPQSALLMHNLAQILVEKAKRPGVSPDEARRRLNQATELLRAALRQDAPRLRRHIHSTRDRLEDLRRALPPSPARDRGPDGPGRPRDRDRGPRDRGRPPQRPQQSQETSGPADRGDRGDRRDAPRPERRPPREAQPKQKFLVDGTVSLGEMILAKLKEQEKG